MLTYMLFILLFFLSHVCVPWMLSFMHNFFERFLFKTFSNFLFVPPAKIPTRTNLFSIGFIHNQNLKHIKQIISYVYCCSSEFAITFISGKVPHLISNIKWEVKFETVQSPQKHILQEKQKIFSSLKIVFPNFFITYLIYNSSRGIFHQIWDKHSSFL